MRKEGVAGFYQLTLQTITKNRAILEGRPCRLDLRLDGSFTVTNYPVWARESSDPPRVTEFVSTTGRWSCGEANISYRGQECWGVVFSNGKVGIHPLALRSKGAPYNLMFIYGDGDEGMVMVFGKKK